MASPSCMLSRNLAGNTHTSDWLKWLEAEIIRVYCTHVSCLWDGMTQSMGLALTPDLRLDLRSPCVFGFAKHGPVRGRVLRVIAEMTRVEAWSLVWLPSESMHCHCLWILWVCSWITKNHSKRRKLVFSLCGEIPSLPDRRACGMEDIVVIGFMKNSLS